MKVVFFLGTKANSEHNYDIDISRAHQSVTIGKCDYNTAGLLNIAVGDPVVEVRRILCDTQDQIIYLADVTYRSDFVCLEMDLLA